MGDKIEGATLNEMSDLFQQTAVELGKHSMLKRLTADERLYATRMVAHYVLSDVRKFCAEHGHSGIIEAWAWHHSLGLKEAIDEPEMSDE